jgi:peptidoglycan/xylan/chitin deacetylase (PgdA/CDA1 family)
MLRKAKLATLGFLQSAGVFRLVAGSRWRRERLLILCYHGISLADEHLWRPNLYMPAALLEKRLKMLRALECSVVPLGEGLERVQKGDLPPRSVALTFDDGTYDFYRQAFPLLRQYGVPVTVYQTTYYTDHSMPVFNLTCSYMLWKRRERPLGGDRDLELSGPRDLSTESARHRVVRHLIELAERENLSGLQKDHMAQRLAHSLGFNYEEFRSKRILTLMNGQELAEVAHNGADIQLHTHRHRTPADEALFRREIRENRERIQALTGQGASHFCYPGGIYQQEFATWLRKENVLSATTCDAGLVQRESNPFLLPRFVDTSGRTEVEFASWLTGIGSMVALHRAAPQRYVPPED